MHSITRKFLIGKMPDISGLSKQTYQRYYLYNHAGVVIRVQEINGTYEIERKANLSELVREEDVISVTQAEFEVLKKLSNQFILRDSYKISDDPKVELRIYHQNFAGLNRLEVSFSTQEEAAKFIPPDWFGREITNSPLSQDGYLLKLSSKEFRLLLDE